MSVLIPYKWKPIGKALETCKSVYRLQVTLVQHTILNVNPNDCKVSCNQFGQCRKKTVELSHCFVTKLPTVNGNYMSPANKWHYWISDAFGFILIVASNTVQNMMGIMQWLQAVTRVALFLVDALSMNDLNWSLILPSSSSVCWWLRAKEMCMSCSSVTWTDICNVQNAQ